MRILERNGGISMIERVRKHTFEGIHSAYDEASIIICGIPFDGTCSNKPGTRFGPMELRKEMDGLETYSPYQNLDMTSFCICDIGDVDLPLGNTHKVVATIYEDYHELLSDKKKIVTLGGEHLITYPVVKAYLEEYPHLHVIHIDAHTDLRDTYLGEELSHATVMKLIYNSMNHGQIYQFGIRSGMREEFEFGRKHTHLHFNTLDGMELLKKDIDSTPVYLTIDLDVLDPSIFPGTGTPEPGGVSFNKLIDALLSLKGLNIVGADIVELSPHYDSSGVSNVVAAKVLREVTLLMAED